MILTLPYLTAGGFLPRPRGHVARYPSALRSRAPRSVPARCVRCASCEVLLRVCRWLAISPAPSSSFCLLAAFPSLSLFRKRRPVSLPRRFRSLPRSFRHAPPLLSLFLSRRPLAPSPPLSSAASPSFFQSSAAPLRQCRRAFPLSPLPSPPPQRPPSSSLPPPRAPYPVAAWELSTFSSPFLFFLSPLHSSPSWCFAMAE